MSKTYKSYQKSNSDKLKKLSKSNPKQFWKLLSSNKSNKCNATLGAMYDYFKNINSGANANGEGEGIEPNINLANANVNIDDNMLNTEISLEEITNAVKKLKNSKASGEDKIVNEYLKHSFVLMKMCIINCSILC